MGSARSEPKDADGKADVRRYRALKCRESMSRWANAGQRRGRGIRSTGTVSQCLSRGDAEYRAESYPRCAGPEGRPPDQASQAHSAFGRGTFMPGGGGRIEYDLALQALAVVKREIQRYRRALADGKGEGVLSGVNGERGAVERLRGDRAVDRDPHGV